MIDTHTHYFLREFDCDRDTLFQKLKENGVSRVIEAAIGMESNFIMRKLFGDNEMVFFGAGIHPLRVACADRVYGIEVCRGILRELLRAPKTVALGETGLDYHREVTGGEDKELQKAYFRMRSLSLLYRRRRRREALHRPRLLPRNRRFLHLLQKQGPL